MGLSVGTVVPNNSPTYSDRVKKTWLSERDLQQLITKALISSVGYGVYYGVSNNKNKFWDISNAQTDLDYKPEDNADLI